MSFRSFITKVYICGKYFAFKHAPRALYPFWLKMFYQIEMKKKLNLEKPQTLNEKIQWLKLYDSTPEKTLLADKYLVREWVKKTIGEQYLIPLLGVWEHFDDINFDNLPNKFVLKCNHGSSCNILVEDKNELNLDNAKKQITRWMNTNYSFFNCELHYSEIPRRIIAEQFIESKEGLKDYRFYCFNGKPNSIWVDVFSGTPNHKRCIYDVNWELLPVRCKWPYDPKFDTPKPENLDLMLNLAEKLSKGFCFVRVDLYDVDGRVLFGEMTFTPMQGTAAFDPESYDKTFGDLLILPNNEK